MAAMRIAQRRMRIVGIEFTFLDLLPDAFRHLKGNIWDHKNRAKPSAMAECSLV